MKAKEKSYGDKNHSRALEFFLRKSLIFPLKDKNK